MADGEGGYRRAPAPGYIYENFSSVPYYEDEQLYQVQRPERGEDRWYKPQTWGENNNWYKPWRWDENPEKPEEPEEERLSPQELTRRGLDDLQRQIEFEEGLSPEIKRIEGEAAFNPFREFLDALGRGLTMQSAAYNPTIPGYSSPERERSRELIERQNELASDRYQARIDAVGAPRFWGEMAAPVVIGAGMAAPVGMGFRALPAAVQSSRFGTMLAPMTGKIGAPVQWAFSRGWPGAIAAGAVTNEIPGQAVPNVADETAAFGAAAGTMMIGDVIKNALKGSRVGKVVNAGTSFAAGMGAGILAGATVGNKVDEQRTQAGRDWAFQNQENLDWAYRRHPEWFPEFPR